MPNEDLLPSLRHYPKRSIPQVDAFTAHSHVAAPVLLESHVLLGASPVDDDEVDLDKIDSFLPWQSTPELVDPLTQIHFSGSPTLQTELRLLCAEFSDIFCSELPSTLADIPPFDLKVDDSRWKVNANRTPPRPQSTAKQAGIVSQLAALERQRCFLGFSELDFVSKVISEEGLKMARSKIQTILDFPIPVVSKQFKSFLGLINCFRDFIRNQSFLVKPLNSMLINYQRGKKLIWTTDGIIAFNTVRLVASSCTTMHFLSDAAPITLHTDASDYGIGGYLFQTLDSSIEQPVTFISKSLSLTQLRWSNIQKEAYAIYHYLLYNEFKIRSKVSAFCFKDKEKDFHVSDIKPFVFDSANIEPSDVARRDHLEFFVEKILGHEGVFKRRFDLVFLVQWFGYDDSHNSFELYSNLRGDSHLHDYLRENFGTQLIPSKFR